MTAHFNRILEVGNEHAITEPGVYYRGPKKEVFKKNLLLFSYPASQEICTVREMARAIPAARNPWPTARTRIEKLNVVLPDGNETINLNFLLGGELFRERKSLKRKVLHKRLKEFGLTLFGVNYLF